MNKRGLTAWEAIRLLSPEPETEAQPPMIKPAWDLWSGGTTWVDVEHDQMLFGFLLQESRLLDRLADGTWHAMGFREPLDPNKQRLRVNRS